MTTVKNFGKDYAPVMTLELQKVKGGVVKLRERLPEYKVREINKQHDNDEQRLLHLVLSALTERNLEGPDGKIVEITEETIQRLPPSDLLRIINAIQGGAGADNQDMEKNG